MKVLSFRTGRRSDEETQSKTGRKDILDYVTLSNWYGHVRGMLYRVLAVPEEFTLYDLAEAIVDSFGFDFDHAFGFYNNIKEMDRVDRRIRAIC